MAKVKFKKLCKKCGKYYTPDGTKMSSFGYCKNCRISKSRCKFINELGYQCQNKPQFQGYCIYHFISTPIKKLIKEIKE